jgi:protein TonB
MKYFLFFVFVFITFKNYAQKNKEKSVSIYVYDEKWNPCNIEDAKYLAQVEKIDDTIWQWKNYNFTGPLLSIETYKDADSHFPHGYFAWFDQNGLIDSAGMVTNGKKHGTWFYYTDTLSVWQSEQFNNGLLLEKKDSVQLREERRKNDSIGFLPGDKEAIFKGGDKAWIKHLQTNLDFPKRAETLSIGGMVKVFFKVDSDGSIKDVRLYKSVEYSLDSEALRLIKKSPNWIPAFQLGKHVKAYRVQPITFGSN